MRKNQRIFAVLKAFLLKTQNIAQKLRFHKKSETYCLRRSYYPPIPFIKHKT